MTTSELAKYISETLAYLNIVHHDYSKLAARVVVNRIHRTTTDSILEYANNIHEFKDESGRDCKLLSEETYKIFKENHEKL